MKGLLRQAAEREKRQLEEIERLKTRVRAMVEVDARWGGTTYLIYISVLGFAFI